MCISGMSFTGTDIGGFAEQPTGELYARWIQLGVFHPFCRTHSSGHHGEQEPWAFDPGVTDIARKFINLRYRLLPYLYTMFHEYTQNGTPLLKPLVYFDQDDLQTHYRTDEFVFGHQILVCPILEPNAKGRRMYIPRGIWYNYWDKLPVEGGKEQWVDADVDSMPLFIKAGSIIPKYPIQQYVGEKKIEQVELEVHYALGKHSSNLYEDAQDGYDYTKERYSYRTFKFHGREEDCVLQQHKRGSFITPYETYRIQFIGLPFEIKEIEVDNTKVSLESVNYDSKACSIEVTKNFTELQIFGNTDNS